MKIFGKTLSEYIAFAWLFLILILITGVLRIVFDSPWLSMTAVMWIGVVYYAVRVHTSGFGSYKQLLPIVALHLLTAQIVIVPAIVVAIFTGVDNIFSLPEYAFGQDGKTWAHAAAHIFIGPTIGSMFGWGVGSLIMAGAKKAAPKP